MTRIPNRAHQVVILKLEMVLAVVNPQIVPATWMMVLHMGWCTVLIRSLACLKIGGLDSQKGTSAEHKKEDLNSKVRSRLPFASPDRSLPTHNSRSSLTDEEDQCIVLVKGWFEDTLPGNSMALVAQDFFYCLS